MKQRKYKRIFVTFMLQNRPKKEFHRRVKLPRSSQNINTLTSQQLLNPHLTEFK